MSQNKLSAERERERELYEISEIQDSAAVAVAERSSKHEIKVQFSSLSRVNFTPARPLLN